MAFDAFIKFNGGGIEGESTDEKHVNWIEVLSFSWGVSQPSAGQRSDRGAAASARADFSDLSFVYNMNKASPKLMLACATGEHIKDVTLQLHRATGKKELYIEYKMADVLIGGVRPGGASQGSSDVPMEEVSLNYGKINFKYVATDHKTGAPKGSLEKWWNRIDNTGG